MADTKISSLTEDAVAIAGDWLAVVDTVAGITKKINVANFTFGLVGADVTYLQSMVANVVQPPTGTISEVLLGATGTIDLTTPVDTTIFTVPGSYNAIVSRVVLLYVSADSTVSGTPDFTLGGNASDYDDYLGTTEIAATELDSVDTIMTYLPVTDTEKKSYPAGTVFKFSQGTDSDSGVVTWQIKAFAFGYLFA